MARELLRTKLALDNCRSHLIEANGEGTEIEAYLAQHILVIMCAEIQQELYAALELRLNQSTDGNITNFALAAGKRILRSIGKGEVVGFVNNFGSAAKNYMNDHLSEREVTLYNNAVANRHDVAHSSGSNITFRELDDILIAASKFINVFEDAIYLP
jgi:hypothetical protein